MPFIAVCPYCQAGRIRAPEKALGLTAPCPRCHASFTLIDSGEPVDQVSAPGAVAQSTATTASVAAAAALAPKAPPVSMSVPGVLVDATTPSISFDDVGPSSFDSNRVPMLIAFTLGGLALIASQVPYGRFGTVGFAALGLVVGAIGCVGARRPLAPIAATVLNALTLVLVLLVPTWLGIDSWRPPKADQERKTVQTFGLDGLTPTKGEWVDSSQSWQFDDVRVRIVVSLTHVELSGPMKKQKWSKTPYVLIRVAVANVGVAREFNVIGWDAKSPPKLTDASGKVIARAAFEPGWSTELRQKQATLRPGESVEHDLLFEAPVDPGAYFRLELPGDPCGAAEQVVRFQIPTQPLGYKSAK